MVWAKPRMPFPMYVGVQNLFGFYSELVKIFCVAEMGKGKYEA